MVSRACAGGRTEATMDPHPATTVVAMLGKNHEPDMEASESCCWWLNWNQGGREKAED